jgi:transcription elongation factor SPT5
LYDLVVLSGGGSANEVGIIVRVGREDFTVVNNHGIARDVRPEELRGKRNQTSNRAVALDVQGNQIRCGDQVNVAEGPHKGKTATIKRMSRAQLFLHSQTRSEHAGTFVVRSRSCVLAGSRTQSRGTAGNGGASPFSSPQSQSQGPAGARGKRDDALIGKTVRIQAGQWKGYLGAVSDATATHVQVELHSRLKKVMVVRERVAVVGDKFGATEEAGQNDPNGANGAAAPVFSGAATPMHGGATPMHGGATPMHDSMSAGDEVWRPGAMDQDSTQAAENGDGWGADSSDQNAFGSPANDANGKLIISLALSVVSLFLISCCYQMAGAPLKVTRGLRQWRKQSPPVIQTRRLHLLQHPSLSSVNSRVAPWKLTMQMVAT